LNIDASDRTTLNGLLDQLRDVLMHDSSSDIARRLFPAAYHQDEQHEQEYQRLMRDELLSSRLASLSLATSLLERETNSDSIVLSADELDALMRSINSLRLVLGTLLDVEAPCSMLMRTSLKLTLPKTILPMASTSCTHIWVGF